MLEKLSGNLVSSGANAITGKTISVRSISIEAVSQDAARASDLDSGSVAHGSGSYELTGRYWVRDDVVDLKVTLNGPNSANASWSGLIKASDLKGLELKPQNKVVTASTLPKAAYTFQVTTGKGTAPVLKAGDLLQLILRSGKDVWSYCFYIDSKAQISTILPLPNKYSTKLSNIITANKVVKLPDPITDKVRFIISSDTVGEEMVTCFSSVRDIGKELPRSFFRENLEPIEFLTIEKLRETFRAIQDAQVAEAAVTISVTR